MAAADNESNLASRALLLQLQVVGWPEIIETRLVELSMDLVSSIAHLSAIHILMAMVPGPNTVVVSYCSAGISRRAGLLAAAGVAAASLIWVTASLFGIGAMVGQTGSVYRSFRIAGAIYLLYVGIRLLRSRPSAADGSAAPVYRTPFLAGFFTTLSNPKSAIFWTSVFAVVIPRQAPTWFYSSVLALMTTQALLWYGTVALALSSEISRRNYQRLSLALTRTAGVCMLAFGLKIAFDIFSEWHTAASIG